jgi:hypothetical protein
MAFTHKRDNPSIITYIQRAAYNGSSCSSHIKMFGLPDRPTRLAGYKL